MLYRLSYASRCKLTIILIGRQIARETDRFFRLLKYWLSGISHPPTPTLPLNPPKRLARL